MKAQAKRMAGAFLIKLTIKQNGIEWTNRLVPIQYCFVFCRN